MKSIYSARKTWSFLFALISVSILSFLMYCASADQTDMPEETPSDPVSVAARGYDPLADPRDKAVLAETPPEDQNLRKGTDNFEWAKVDSFMQANKATDSIKTIYRVQLFASQYYTEAQYEKQIAEEVFSDSVYVLYDLPYYKLMLGNATSENHGRRLLNNARALGYSNSWLVESAPDSLYFRSLYARDTLNNQNTPDTLENQDSIPETDNLQEPDQ